MSEFEIDLEIPSTDNSIGLGDEDKGKVVSNSTDWYKAEKGRTDRVALVYFNTLEVTTYLKAERAHKKEAGRELTSEEKRSLVLKIRAKIAETKGKPFEQLAPYELLDLLEPRFKKVTGVYRESGGYSIVPDNLTPEESRVWQKYGEAKDYVCTVLLKYATSREGDVDAQRINEFQVLPWKFSPQIFDTLRKISKGLVEQGTSASKLDLTISCTDSKYQKITVTPSGPCIYQKNETFKQRVLEKALVLYKKAAAPFPSKTTAEIREKLGLGGGVVIPAGSDNVNYDDVLQNI